MKYTFLVVMVAIIALTGGRPVQRQRRERMPDELEGKVEYYVSKLDGERRPYVVCATDESDEPKPMILVVHPGGTGLENAMNRAKACVTAEDYKSALKIISDPIASAPPSPLRSEAQFVRAEAAYRLLPHKPTKFAMELVDSYIETFIADAPGHPRTSEALQWKAGIFERAGVPYAAHDTYERILRDMYAL